MNIPSQTNPKKIAGILGLSSTALFIAALILFGLLNPNFHFIKDFVSKLGAKGEPNALGWNIVGFGLVGVLLVGFGVFYGRVLHDSIAGWCLALFGVGFSFTAFPVDFLDENSALSKVHILAICLALAFWLFGLARIGYSPSTKPKIKNRAHLTSGFIIVPIIGAAIELWSMPLTHRLVFLVVFGWTVVTSVELLLIRGQ